MRLLLPDARARLEEVKILAAAGITVLLAVVLAVTVYGFLIT